MYFYSILLYQAAALSPPLPTLDAGREWPYARHLHTPQEIKQFKEAQEEVDDDDTDTFLLEKVKRDTTFLFLVLFVSLTAYSILRFSPSAASHSSHRSIHCSIPLLLLILCLSLSRSYQ